MRKAEKYSAWDEIGANSLMNAKFEPRGGLIELGDAEMNY